MVQIHAKHKVNITRVIAKVVLTILALWVGDKVLIAINSALMPLNASGNLTSMTTSNSYFYQGFNFLGIGTATNGAATPTGAGILGVIALIAVASLVMEFVEISF